MSSKGFGADVQNFLSILRGKVAPCSNHSKLMSKETMCDGVDGFVGGGAHEDLGELFAKVVPSRFLLPLR